MISTLLTKCVALGIAASTCQLVTDAAQTNDVDPALFHAIIFVESSYRPNAQNPVQPGVAVSSFGLGQLTIDTAKHHCNLLKDKIFDARKNVMCAAKVLAYQLKRYGGDNRKAIAAYNSGTAFFTSSGELRNLGYVQLVLQRLSLLGEK